jgi:3-oxoadipate enol-lactonase
MLTKVNGIGVNVEIDGAVAGPWLVFSNSLMTNLTMWDPQLAAFASNYRILRYDQRGHGKTQATPGAYSFDLLVDDIKALMDAVGIDRASFCGLSMGGGTGLGLAQRYPERVEKLIMCDSSGGASAASAQQWNERINVAKTNGMTALVEPTISRWFPQPVVSANPPYLDKVRAMIRATSLEGFCGCASALGSYDYRPGIGKVGVPVLLLVGEKDGTTPAAMRQIQAQFPNSCYAELEGAGHISNLDNTAEFNRQVAEFLSA